MTLIPNKYNCPECKDTGIYQGLNTVEPCRACGITDADLSNAVNTVMGSPGLPAEMMPTIKPIAVMMNPVSSERTVELLAEALELGTITHTEIRRLEKR